MATKKESTNSNKTSAKQSTQPQPQQSQGGGAITQLQGAGMPLAVNSGHLDVSIGGLDNITVGNMHTRTDLMVSSKEAGQKLGALEKVTNGLRVAIAEQTAVRLSIELETEKVKTATAAAEYSGAVSNLKDAIDKAGHDEFMAGVNSERRGHNRRQAIAETVIAADRANKKEAKAEGLSQGDADLAALYADLKGRYQQVTQNQQARGWSTPDATK